MPVIELERVDKWYGKQRGIEDVTLSIGRGEVFGYLGPNGAGKSTTIRLLVDLLRPTGGRVLVFGSDPHRPEVRTRIGYLPGELALYPELTGGELLTYLDHLRDNGALEHAWSLCERLELDPSRRIGELSRGNKQKIGLIQAFMHHPELLILDEPTSGLDPLVQQEFYRMLEEARAAGATVFLSSHVLSEVERITQRVGIIREGRLVEVAPLADLRARAVRRFEITLAEAPSEELFAGIANLSEVTIDGNVITCAVTGSVDALIGALASHRVLNLISHGADLEDLFLTYYRGDPDVA